MAEVFLSINMGTAKLKCYISEVLQNDREPHQKMQILKVKLNEKNNYFHISRDCFNVTLAPKNNEQKKAIAQTKHIEEEDLREAHMCLLKIKTYKKRSKHCKKKVPLLEEEKN